MGHMIEYARADGTPVTGYLAMPAAAESAPGVVVIHEAWGLASPKSNTCEVADRLAAAGYRALAPDLYRGKQATTREEMGPLMKSLDWSGAVADIAATAEHLKGHHVEGGKVAVLGFCLGGALTILSAVNLALVDAAVCFYGVPPAAAADPALIKVPLLGHFATHDDWVTAAVIEGLEDQLTAGGVSHRLHVYEAHHAFMNDKRPEVYDAVAATLAWERSLEFLASNLR